MKNKIRFRKLGRPTAARKALFSSQVAALLQHERIRTTLPKAKELRRFADRVVTWAKEGSHQYRVKALGFVKDKTLVNKLWTEIGPRYLNRAGGYTRVLRCGYRAGDRAPMAIIEYVDRPGEIRLSRPGTATAVATQAAQTATPAAAPASTLPAELR